MLQPCSPVIWTWHSERTGICLYPQAGWVCVLPSPAEGRLLWPLTHAAALVDRDRTTITKWQNTVAAEWLTVGEDCSIITHHSIAAVCQIVMKYIGFVCVDTNFFRDSEQDYLNTTLSSWIMLSRKSFWLHFITIPYCIVSNQSSSWALCEADLLHCEVWLTAQQGSPTSPHPDRKTRTWSTRYSTKGKIRLDLLQGVKSVFLRKCYRRISMIQD